MKKSNLVLRERMRDIQQDLLEWDSFGGMTDGENSGEKGFLQ
jgi:hypothetical protein